MPLRTSLNFPFSQHLQGQFCWPTMQNVWNINSKLLHSGFFFLPVKKSWQPNQIDDFVSLIFDFCSLFFHNSENSLFQSFCPIPDSTWPTLNFYLQYIFLLVNSCPTKQLLSQIPLGMRVPTHTEVSAFGDVRNSMKELGSKMPKTPVRIWILFWL